MKGVRFTALAKSDLQEIHDFISRDNPKVATDYLLIIKKHCELLAANPKLGVKREEYFGLYKLPVDNYLSSIDLVNQVLKLYECYTAVVILNQFYSLEKWRFLQL